MYSIYTEDNGYVQEPNYSVFKDGDTYVIARQAPREFLSRINMTIKTSDVVEKVREFKEEYGSDKVEFIE